MNYAIILAGGIGSRFWPLSSDSEPKQFLPVYSSKPMLKETIERIAHFIKKKNTYVAANAKHRGKINTCLKGAGIKTENIFFEPRGKNTFAPIAYLAQRIQKIDPEAVISILPCDHVIQNNKKFLQYLAVANKIADRQRAIVTFGIKPKRPETGYGYIKIKSQVLNSKSQNYFSVEKFVEKPDEKRAKEYIKDGRYYWNSGIFIFRADLILSEIAKLQPQAFKDLNKSLALKCLWEKLPTISIDYAIMEKTKKIALLPVQYGWIDLGSWQAIEEIMKKDKNGNIFKGDCVDIGSKNTLVWSSCRKVATVGLKDTVIVETKDAILVCAKGQTQAVKQIAQKIKK